MSNSGWQNYIDVSLIGTGNIDQAAIISRDCKSVWANSKGFEISANERKVLSEGIGEPGNSSPFFEHGITFNKIKYIVVTHDDDHIYARKEKTGVVVCATNQAIIIGTHPGTIDRFRAVDTVMALSDYLKGVGY